MTLLCKNTVKIIRSRREVTIHVQYGAVIPPEPMADIGNPS